MSSKLIYIYFAIILLAQILTFSCRKLGCTDPNAINFDSYAKKSDNSCEYALDTTFSIKFSHFFGDDIFSLDSIYTDDYGNKIQFSRANFYLGKFHFKDSTKEIVDNSNKYLLISATETDYDYDTINSTNIYYIDFILGVDSITNHLDPASYESANDLSYQTPSMHWQMGLSPSDWSYLFIVLEGKVDINNNQNFESGENFIFHIGGDDFSLIKNNLQCNIVKTGSSSVELNLKANWDILIREINLSIDNFTHTSDNFSLATKVIENSEQFITANF